LSFFSKRERQKKVVFYFGLRDSEFNLQHFLRQKSTESFVPTFIRFAMPADRMCDFFQESWMPLKDPLTNCRDYERINTQYHCPLSHTKLQYSIRYRFNESVPSAIENKLLRWPEYESIEAKLALLVPICRNILETCPKIWLTVTGIELYTTEDNTLQWRVFEDKDEVLTRIPTADLPQHVVKVDISDLEKISMLNHIVFTADYDYETYVLKLHRASHQEHDFPAEVMARIKAAGLPHINEMEAVVVNNRYDPERSYVEGILLQYCQRGSLESVLKESDPPIDAVTKKRWAAQIAHGIAALHGVGLLHGDLRCGNIVIDDKTTHKLSI
jgi:hypothetical protein